jgi:hypothetical protein
VVTVTHAATPPHGQPQPAAAATQPSIIGSALPSASNSKPSASACNWPWLCWRPPFPRRARDRAEHHIPEPQARCRALLILHRQSVINGRLIQRKLALRPLMIDLLSIVPQRSSCHR